jgi:hypothetical protein
MPKREESSDMKRGMALALIPAVLGAVGLLLTLTVGTASAGTTVSGVHAATAPPVGNGLLYTANTRVLSANGTSTSGVTCPSGALPVGGGTAMQNPQTEHVAQAGFVVSAATGKPDGYEASVQVSGLARGTKVRFAVQVACVPSGTTAVSYAVHTLLLSANGTSGWGVSCPFGTLPVGGGTAVQNPQTEHVAQAGFMASAAAGKLDGYEASVQVNSLTHGTSVRFAVQVACVPSATTFVIYAVHAQALSADGTSSPGVACPVGTGPAGGGTAVEDPLAEHVTQAGFVVSATTGKVNGYEASVQVNSLTHGTSVRFAVQVACIKPVTAAIYGPPTLARSASTLSP